jgi:hypothetical protein
MPKLPQKTDPPAGLGKGRNGATDLPSAIGKAVRLVAAGNPREPLDGRNLVKRRHIDWLEHQIRWRWLLDSYEGGERYRNAVYGPDRKGLPLRNLFRHRREYPNPQEFPSIYQGFAGASTTMLSGATAAGTGLGPWPGMLGADPAATAQDDDYELRRARTPVPEFVGEAVEIHLSKVYDQEVSRTGPADLEAWWKDVDGRGTPMDDWMRETVAPLLLVLGCLDVVLDHPQAPPGQTVRTRADELELGLDTCVASYVLPQNMLWWRTDAAGRYVECLIREYTDPSDRVDTDKRGNTIDPEDKSQVGENWRRLYTRYRYWNAEESIVFNHEGDKILERMPHRFGRVPIVRLIDIKKHRTPMIGKSRYEAIAELQREFYNRDSELILSDTLQAHPFLSGAEDFCKADNTLSVGPQYVLPKKKNPESGAYEGWEYVSPPKDPAESLRKNKADLVDMKDRRACLTKPAGVANAGTGTVSQSGVSKQLDAMTGHKLLVAIAKSLAKCERYIADYALLVLRNGETPTAEGDAIAVGYPARFDLNDATTLVAGTAQLQLVMEACGNAPNTERELIQATIRQLLVGLDDDAYREMDDEIGLLVETKAKLKEQIRELGPPVYRSTAEALAGEGTDEGGGADRSGQSGGTQVSNVIPSVM